MKRVYIAGDMLTAGSRLLREKEQDDIAALGLDVYSPLENASINDKSNLDSDKGLAEHIVAADTAALLEADIIIIEPLPSAIGTTVELGQIKGMQDMAATVADLCQDHARSPSERLEMIEQCVQAVLDKQVMPHYEDIRRFPGVAETEDRRALGINQYVYGVCLEFTDGRGFYEWEDILELLQAQDESLEVTILPGPATDDPTQRDTSEIASRGATEPMNPT